MLYIKFPVKPLLEDYNLSDEIIDSIAIAKKKYRQDCEKLEKHIDNYSFVIAELLFFVIGMVIYLVTEHETGISIIPHVPDIIIYGFISCLSATFLYYPLLWTYKFFLYIFTRLFHVRISTRTKNNEYNYSKYLEALHKYEMSWHDILRNNPFLDKYEYDITKYERAILDAAYNHVLDHSKEFLKRSNANWWRELDPFAFEEEVANWFRGKNYTATVTKKSGDGGYDIVLYKDGKKYYVQCKHYNTQVGVKLVREFYGVLVADRVEEGFMVILDKGYTKDAQDFLNGKNIRTITLYNLTSGYLPKLKKIELENMFVINNAILFKEVFEDVPSAKKWLEKTLLSDIDKIKLVALSSNSQSIQTQTSLFKEDLSKGKVFTFGLLDNYLLGGTRIHLPVVLFGEYEFLIFQNCSFVFNSKKHVWEEMFYHRSGTLLSHDEVLKMRKEKSQKNPSYRRNYNGYHYRRYR